MFRAADACPVRASAFLACLHVHMPPAQVVDARQFSSFAGLALWISSWRLRQRLWMHFTGDAMKAGRLRLVRCHWHPNRSGTVGLFEFLSLTEAKGGSLVPFKEAPLEPPEGELFGVPLFFSFFLVPGPG